MVDMRTLVVLIRYYFDLIGQHKLSSQKYLAAYVKTEAVRSKVAQEACEELQNTRQEAL
ncbi:hypothetical protein RJ641_013016 [Dillenia turbinata]|uniref:Uncharacterized protein n=1 Tax=Dillenia turbinata TaxID=194707 RepID=A0AAN8WBW6_9MAGN